MDHATTPAAEGDGRSDQARLVSIDTNDRITTFRYSLPERPPRFQIEHDRKRRQIRVVETDGATRVFRARPTRYLVVVPNPLTGEIMPMMRYGEPEYLVLCPEEREKPRREISTAPGPSPRAGGPGRAKSKVAARRRSRKDFS